VIFVDDGSSDGSWNVICSLADADERMRGLRLSRNFGAHIAVSAGMQNPGMDPDAVVTLAADLQDPPETVVDMLQKWKGGADVVWAVRETRDEKWWRVAASRWFQAALRRWAMPRGSLFTTGGFILLDRKVLAAVAQMREHNRINFALVAWTGFDQARVMYDRKERIAGKSGWRFSRMVRAMYDAFVGFSTLPIRAMTYSAVGAALLALGVTIELLVSVTIGHPIPGWTSVVLVPSVFFAIQFALTAILGEYLHRIYSEAVRRPLFFVSDDTEENSG